jgi:hypothetical protein
MASSAKGSAYKEKRSHRRLYIRLPLEYRKRDAGRSSGFRTMTINVSTGGVYFETTDEGIRVGDILDFELGIPPGDSRFPLPGRIANKGKVVRTIAIQDQDVEIGVPSYSRFGVAAQFQEEFKIMTSESRSESV